MELWKLLGDLHPKLVQFPLVLLLAGLVFDAIGVVRTDRRWNWAAVILSATGTAFLLVAFICGIYAEVWAGRAGVPQDPIEWHEFLANVASWGFVILMAWRLLIGPNRRRQLAAYTMAGLAYYGLLVLAAYLGGQLVFHYGAAVSGARANTVLSLHDLNTLATRQTDANLDFSERMHHVFGWLTVALAGSLVANAAFPTKAAKLRWVGPALLGVGGVFLFLCADLDLYHLTDLRQLRDREVQLHKTIAVVLVVVGVVGLRRGTAVSAAGVPSKLVAVMALIGGGMLFTHVHTVAPYANVAAGVYIAHTVMGLTALTVGAARLAQDGWPRYRRAFGVVFAVAMSAEAALLVTYNEGLPWYVGYGRYNRWGPHGGTVAPFGGVRAELTYDEAAHRIDVYTLDRSTDRPAPVKTAGAELLVAQGYREVAVPVRQVDAGSGCHFAADVPWMAGTAAFSARMALPVRDGAGVVWRTGYFDPWVSAKVWPVPPNEVARFQCPMHDGIVSANDGRCPICHMAMVPYRPDVRATPHDDPYGLTLTTADAAGASATAGRPVPAADPLRRRLTFTPLKGTERLRHLPTPHEFPLHVTVVSDDLSSFAHVHPAEQADGTLELEHTFPEAGHYVVFAEYMPVGQRDQVFRFPVTVGDVRGDRRPAALTPTPADATPVPGFPTMTAELVRQPRTLTAGTHAMLLFRLSDHGQPVTDVEPFMNAMGHCAVVSEDGRTLLHSHPEQLGTPTADARGGPDFAFHVLFPAPGRYKVWGQFKRDGRVVVVPFVVDVERPVLPSRVVNFILNDY